MGLDGEGVVLRCRALAAERAAANAVRSDAEDHELEAAAARLLEDLARDRKLRRPLRDDTVREIALALVTWEVVRASVGPERAEARYAALRGYDPSPPPATPPASGEGAAWQHPPDGPAEPARQVGRRQRRLDDPAVSEAQVAGGLLDAVRAEPAADDDPQHDDGFDHYVWLEEWLEFAVGREVFDGLEAGVAAHADVTAAFHQDREVLYVAAPTLHPDDVRAVVLALITDHFDPDWESRITR